MYDDIDVVWISSSPVLQRFDKPLLQYISQYVNVAQWEYISGKDEGNSIDEAVELLDEFFSECAYPINLAGHGAGGAIALTYARRYPEKVRSLVLLSVASQPAHTWHVHYYLQRQLFPLSRDQILANTVRNLFGEQPHNTTKKLISVLKRDLDQTPLNHSLFKLIELPKGGVSMPMMVCGSQNDPIVNSPTLEKWIKMFKPEDDFWEYSKGYHFFHYFYPQPVGEAILRFWRPYHSPVIAKTQLFSSSLKN
ncbi:hypothetical protein BCD64_06480 [Nostoc sp. MBR 210]|nr:hypothetical protein BCD64_06480 [Nostoc sp. MBR 210]